MSYSNVDEMTKRDNPKALITTGCILWIVSYFGEIAAYQPYSTIGLVISSLLSIIGLIFWLRFYKSTRGHYPKFWTTYKENLKIMRNNPLGGVIFMFKHILEIWTMVIFPPNLRR